MGELELELNCSFLPSLLCNHFLSRREYVRYVVRLSLPFLWLFRCWNRSGRRNEEKRREEHGVELKADPSISSFLLIDLDRQDGPGCKRAGVQDELEVELVGGRYV